MKVELTFDEFFKQGSSAFFRHLGFQVETEFELFKLPKKLDLLIIKADEVRIPDNFELLTYFKTISVINPRRMDAAIGATPGREARWSGLFLFGATGFLFHTKKKMGGIKNARHC